MAVPVAFYMGRSRVAQWKGLELELLSCLLIHLSTPLFSKYLTAYHVLNTALGTET
jgi:hypothetical protein